MTTLEMYRGDAKSFDITITQDSLPLNLTDKALWVTAKRKRTDPDDQAVFQRSSTDSPSGVTVTNAAAGEARLQLEPSDTDHLPGHKVTLWCDVQVVSSGDPCTAIIFKLVVFPDVTQKVA